MQERSSLQEAQDLLKKLGFKADLMRGPAPEFDDSDEDSDAEHTAETTSQEAQAATGKAQATANENGKDKPNTPQL